MDARNEMSAEHRRLKGNEVLRLDDPGTCWLIESGSLALFAVGLRHGVPDGPRRYFFSSGAGEALFGFLEPGRDGSTAVLAVALEDVTLRVLSEQRLQAIPGASLFERWSERWVESLGGADDEPGDPERPTAQAALLRRIDEVRREEVLETSARFEERERRSRAAVHDAIGNLTAVIEPERTDWPEGPELFVAASLVGRFLEVPIQQSAAWQRLEAQREPLELIARASHLRVRRVLLHDGWWNQDGGPLLAFAGKKRRPVALLPTSPARYEIVEPATRSRQPVDRAVAETLDPQAWVFYRPLPEQTSRSIELLKFALHHCGRDLQFILVAAAAATLLGMVTPQATALLIDYAIPDADRGALLQIGFGLVAAVFGASAFRLAQGLALMRVESHVDVATQSAVWDRLLNLQLSFFRKYSSGDLESRVTAVGQIRSYLSGTTLRTLFSGVALLLNLFLLLYYSPMLTVVAVVVALATSVATVAFGVRILRCARQILEIEGRFFGLMVQLIQGVAKLRVAAAEDRAFARWAREYAHLLGLEYRQRRTQDTVFVLNMAFSTLSAIVLFGLAASLIRPAGGSAGLTTGVFLAFHVAYGTFIGAIMQLSNTVVDVMTIAILRERVRPILEATPEVHDRKADPGPLEGRIDLDHVFFRYQADGPLTMNDVSLQVAPGEFIALVGPSGSGKSTLLRLMLGFETPLSGSIRVDGQDLSGLDVLAVRQQMGVVLQNGRINAGSIFDNVVSGTQASLGDAWEAARATAFAEEIEAMPMGMHTIISEGGTNLSGGQRQRLLITRALVHKPRILLLDEATSALDNKTQAVVSESLDRLEITRLVIAHRLSTIRHADRIYVIEAGRVVQQGRFETLAREEGLFARLMARQMA